MPPKRTKAAFTGASATREASSEGRSTCSVSDGARSTRSESNPASGTQELSAASTSHEASASSENNTRSSTSTGAVPKPVNTSRTGSTTVTASRSSSRNGAVSKTANTNETGSTTGAATRTSRRTGAVSKTANPTGAVPKTANSTAAVPKISNSTGAVPKTANTKTGLTTEALSRTLSASGTTPASRTFDTSVIIDTTGTLSSTSAEEASILVVDNIPNPTQLSVWDMTVDLTSPIRGDISTASSMTGARIPTASNMREILENLDELTIVSPTTPFPQRPARRPRTPLARNTMGTRYTMSPPRPNTAVVSHFGVSPPRLHPSLTSSATPPRYHNVLDVTIDLTDSPSATPASPEEISPGSSGIRCPVCLDGLPHITSTRRTMMSTVCGHIFCSTCLPACIRSNGRCPTCRKILRQNDMHPIFI